MILAEVGTLKRMPLHIIIIYHKPPINCRNQKEQNKNIWTECIQIIWTKHLKNLEQQNLEHSLLIEQ